MFDDALGDIRTDSQEPFGCIFKWNLCDFRPDAEVLTKSISSQSFSAGDGSAAIEHADGNICMSAQLPRRVCCYGLMLWAFTCCSDAVGRHPPITLYPQHTHTDVRIHYCGVWPHTTLQAQWVVPPLFFAFFSFPPIQRLSNKTNMETKQDLIPLNSFSRETNNVADVPLFSFFYCSQEERVLKGSVLSFLASFIW